MKRFRRAWLTVVAGCVGVGLPLTASAQPLLADRPLDLHIGRLILVLVICIALAIAAAILLKRATKGRANILSAPWLPKLEAQSVAVLESRRISMHADVCRLAYSGREYLIVVSPGGATLLKESDAPAESAP